MTGEVIEALPVNPVLSELREARCELERQVQRAFGLPCRMTSVPWQWDIDAKQLAVHRLMTAGRS